MHAEGCKKDPIQTAHRCLSTVRQRLKSGKKKKWKKDATFTLVDQLFWLLHWERGSLTSNGKIAENNRVKKRAQGRGFLFYIVAPHSSSAPLFWEGTGTSQTQTIISIHGTFWSSQINIHTALPQHDCSYFISR
jgi:hypothetical protein